MPVRVVEAVGKHGRVTVVYGGVKIEVLDTKNFPWYQVFLVLLELGQQVWIEKHNEQFFIVSKPKPT